MSVPAHPHGPPMHFEELTQQWKNNPATTIQIALLTRFASALRSSPDCMGAVLERPRNNSETTMSNGKRISMVAAMATIRVIRAANDIPWKVPASNTPFANSRKGISP